MAKNNKNAKQAANPAVDQLKLKNLDPRNPQHAAIMQGIQGNILKGHGRDHTANIFLEFTLGKVKKRNPDGTIENTTDEKLLLIKKYMGTLVADHLTSCYTQLSEREIYKRNHIPGGLNMFMFFTKTGLENIGAENVSQLNDDAFIAGMKGRKAQLNDSDANTWDGGFTPKKDGEDIEIHCMLLLADADERRLCITGKEIINKLTDDENDRLNPLANILTVEYGHAIRNANGDGLEHNGYVDGISQPFFLKDEIDDYLKSHDIGITNTLYFDPVFQLKQVLVIDPLVANKNAYGSYFVFRKLEQNVRKFKQDEAKIGKKLFPNPDESEEREIAGAMLVGRFEDGTPVQVQHEAGLFGSGAYNNFTYPTEDPSDGMCPHFAHIRKTNGRKLKNDDLLNPTMARRGIPFGHRDVSTETDPVPEQTPERGVGLLFMSYQASIENQFEKIQGDANQPTAGKLDIDPVIGQQFIDDKNDPTTKALVSGGDGYLFKTGQNIGEQSFNNHITMKGGEYFFAPSMAFLQSL